MSNIYDVAIIGAGVAGAFSTYKIAKDYPDTKLLVLDIGRPPMKRRRQLEGWLGCFPGSDAKLYLNNLEDVANLTGKRKLNSAWKEFKTLFNDIDPLEEVKNKSPLVSFIKKINKLGFQSRLDNFIQLEPKKIHMLSKHMASFLDDNKNIDCFFDEEVLDLRKDKKIFTIITETEELKAKKIIFSPGRSGWRWAHQIYKKFGIVQGNTKGKYGIKIETDASALKDLNKSNCTLFKDDQLTVGSFNWGGTIIPEDHVDCAITAFRSNENRWKTDKVCFDLLQAVEFEKGAVEEVDRIAKLTFLLANDRVVKEKLSHIVTGKSKISIMKEYGWVKGAVELLDGAIPNLIEKSNFYFPTIIAATSEIQVFSNLETEVDGMYVAGESAGISGILSAACMGLIAAENICKG
jgi:uncharacterized FAD-dependent dehydrogenase